MLAIVDMRISNLRSVYNALRRVGVEAVLTSDPKVVGKADAIILPGVGAFANAIDYLRLTGLRDVLLQRAGRDGVPLLGICLGMQLLADISEEYGETAGLGLIPGRVVRLESTSADYRVPNIGWYETRPRPKSVLFKGLKAQPAFYFVHSYQFVCADPAHVAATIQFDSRPASAAVERDNVFGVQFHPERSQDHGLDLLESFARHVVETGQLNRVRRAV